MNRLPRITVKAAALVTLLAGFAGVCPVEAAESAHSMYTRALARERQLRNEASAATLAQLRRTVQSYESVVRRYPTSGYSDNALWHAANLALLAFERFGEPVDRKAAVRLLTHLKEQYPASPLVARAAQTLQQLSSETSDAPPAPVPVSPAPALQPSVARAADNRGPRAAETSSETGMVTIRGIKRTLIPDGVRVSIEADGESLFRSERLENPRRVFFDLKEARATGTLQDATLKFGDGVVREIRLGRRPNRTTSSASSTPFARAPGS